MLFYTSDFLTGVALMSMKERGQYITLLCLQQQRGHMTAEEMKKAVGPMSDELMSKFVEDDEGKLYNKRADYEISKRAAHLEKQKANIEKRWKKEKSGTQVGNSMVYTTELPLEKEKENNISGVKKEIGECEGEGKTIEVLPFDTFWANYPKKKAKSAAMKAFAKISADDKVKIIPALEAQKKSQDWLKNGGQYIPYPASWLNGHRWEDEIDPEPKTKGELQFEQNMSMIDSWLKAQGGTE